MKGLLNLVSLLGSQHFFQAWCELNVTLFMVFQTIMKYQIVRGGAILFFDKFPDRYTNVHFVSGFEKQRCMTLHDTFGRINFHFLSFHRFSGQAERERFSVVFSI